MYRLIQVLSAAALCLAICLTGCKKDDNNAISESEQRDVLKQYATLVSANYTDCLTTGKALQAAIVNFTDQPSAQTLEAARTAWLAARVPYGQTEAFRFYDGPIEEVDGYLNSWPMDEAYLDYVVGAPNAGIINDTVNYPTLTANTFLFANGQGAETNICTGYHAIEFLLWGQDLNANGPGNRPYTDYIVGGGALHPERRKQCLLILAQLLVTHLQTLVDGWAPDQTDNYRTSFVAGNIDGGLRDIFRGIGALDFSELRGERIAAAYDSQEQEDEHSCFSDNTHNDIILNARGIANVYLGEYTRLNGEKVSGPSVASLVKKKNAQFDEAMQTQLEATRTAAAAIPPPFDQAIISTEGRAKILAVIEALESQAKAIQNAGKALGQDVNILVE